jgi:hypothetical protein
MTNNGGGDLCLGRAMLKLLYPNSPNYGPTDMPLNPLSFSLAKYASDIGVRDTEWSASFYSNMNQTRYNNSDISWLYPGVVRARGSTKEALSNLIDIGLDCLLFLFALLKLTQHYYVTSRFQRGGR